MEEGNAACGFVRWSVSASKVWQAEILSSFFVKYRVNNVINEYTAHRVASSPDAVQFQLNGLPVPNGSSGKFVDWTGFHSWFCAVLQFTFYYEQSLLWCSFLSWSYLTSFCWISMHFVSWTRYLVFINRRTFQIPPCTSHQLFYFENKEWKNVLKIGQKEWKIILCRVSFPTQIFQF